ncbi:ABC-type transport auxiliary lipoprotein family protein [Serratia microhaemolytica]|uniref:ABC-type transport auxiliary lipoprotein family protein n=1 Tax=Serratia microhaemolytica TaxID=2675110 RepID=UPI000FDF3EFB|nr:ABC-type transport auxiliary lipoprotein family protein [Serratia microhaemolytica]
MRYFNLMANSWRRYLPLLLVMILAGCTIIPESPVSQVYLLPAKPGVATATATKPLNRSLRIAQPNTSQFLAGARIAVQPQGSEITVYSGARWSDPTPALLRNRLIQEFRAHGYFRSVSSDEDNLQADYELGGDLTSFQSIYQGKQGEVVIRFDARILRVSDRRVVASRSFVVRQPIEGRNMQLVVKAFGNASDQLAASMVNWTTQQVRN